MNPIAVNLQTLLGEMAVEEFLRDYYHCRPFTTAGAASTICPLGSWEMLGEILGRPEADVLVVRDGQQYAGPTPTNARAARQLSREGYTILVRHAERHDEQLRNIAAAIARDLAGEINIHIYATPPGRHGFSWHYDAEDVFIFQTAGRKEYALRKNTVNPWPLAENMPRDMRYEREIMPLMRVMLQAGDWLYIPCGWWHKADALAGDETAISLALGVMSPTAIDVYDFLRPYLVQSLVWRQRLPSPKAASPEDTAEASDPDEAAQWRTLFERLAVDLAKMMRDDRVRRDFLDHFAGTFSTGE